MADTFLIEGLNTLPEQVQINKEDIKTLNAKIDTITSNIASLGWELKTNTIGDKSYIPKNFDENIPYSLTNITDSTQASGLNTYKDTDGYVWSFLTIYIPEDDDFVGIWTGHDNTDGYFCSLSMATPNDKTTYLVVTYIANSDSPQSLNKDTYKEDQTIATMGWVNKYYLTKTDASNTYLTKQDYDKRYDTGKIVLTENGFNKIKTMAEEVGTTIELFVITDFTENVQLNNTNELKLNVFAESVEPIYRNIHLVPNQTIDDYDQLQYSSESTWYTGNAMLNLPSQDLGHFAISYLKGDVLILTLIATF